VRSFSSWRRRPSAAPKDGFLVEEDVQSFINEAQASDVLR